MRNAREFVENLALPRRPGPFRAVLAGLILLAGSGVAAEPPAETSAPETAFLTRARQLTFEGARAGEGYFSVDGTRLVFQSEREPGNPFYQIYELDLDSGESRRISPGQGKTTCAFFHPDGKRILFASTHHDPRSADLQREENEFRSSGRKRRYAWDFDPEMDLYVLGEADSPVRLTRARGYDAEASFSPDGNWIVFTSNRDGYNRELDEREQKQRETDASFFAEIYRMRSDGTKIERLTDEEGYDGGPFYTPDGRHIVWRRFDSGGLIADIWTMDADGNNPRRVTEFKSMSWAPYPHPSGEYFLFTSNKHGFDNFELFIVDVAGRREPVRVTYTPGFDGLPVPSPDGKRLAWTTTRNGKSAQLWVGKWNHEQALDALRRAPLRGAAGGAEKRP